MPIDVVDEVLSIVSVPKCASFVTLQDMELPNISNLKCGARHANSATRRQDIASLILVHYRSSKEEKHYKFGKAKQCMEDT